MHCFRYIHNSVWVFLLLICIVSLHADLIALITVILQDLHQVYEQENIF